MKSALVVVVSTRAAQGIYEDQTGPILVQWLRKLGFSTPEARVVADADVADELRTAITHDLNVLITTGGTGLSDDDRTVEAVAPYLDRELPGVVNAFWRKGEESTALSVVSRAVAGVSGRTFIMTLPGSRGAVADGIAVLTPIIMPITDMLEGTHTHD